MHEWIEMGYTEREIKVYTKTTTFSLHTPSTATLVALIFHTLYETKKEEDEDFES
jgi:hypothetical protein